MNRKDKEIFLRPLWLQNPVTIQVLGICSALAVTVRTESALVMGVAVTAVTAFSCLILSSMRHILPSDVRIMVQLVVVSAFVILVDMFLKAYLYSTWRALTVFVGLIITNCIIMGRIESFSLSHSPWHAFLDGAGSGIGYALVLCVVALLREGLGTGTVFQWQWMKVFTTETLGYVPCGFMILPPMALITLGFLVAMWTKK
ncbi:MAG: NADH:ubiquinone reductase (Na(+)-transporting) subunit D [Flavobacteriales bacterium]|nr:NADH:ubiquinone reductase (Na(+)-transporting) subunit D [Flavobacteriales bacterium]